MRKNIDNEDELERKAMSRNNRKEDKGSQEAKRETRPRKKQSSGVESSVASLTGIYICSHFILDISQIELPKSLRSSSHTCASNGENELYEDQFVPIRPSGFRAGLGLTQYGQSHFSLYFLLAQLIAFTARKICRIYQYSF